MYLHTWHIRVLILESVVREMLMIFYCFCQPKFCPAFSGTQRGLSLSSLSIMSVRSVGCCTDAPSKRMIISGAHFIYLLIFVFPIFSLLRSLSHAHSVSWPCPPRSSIPYCHHIKTTLICVLGWNGTFNGFFSFLD